MTGAVPVPVPFTARSRVLIGAAQAGMFVFGIVVALVGAVVPVLASSFSITLADVGGLFLVMNAAMVIASLVAGLALDRAGLKVAVAGGAALVAAALVLTAQAGEYATLVPAVACLGFGGGALNAGTNTLVADLHDDDARKAAALNLLGVFYGFGALALPFAIGMLTVRIGVAALLAGTAVLCASIAAVAAALRFPAPKQRSEWPLAALPRFMHEPPLRALGLLLFFESGNEFLLGGYLATFLSRESGLTLAVSSYALAAYWAAIMAARGALSKLLLHVNPWFVVLGGAAAAASGAFVVSVSRTPALAVGGTILIGVALAGIFPSVLGLTGARYRERSGTVFGLLFTVALCGGMIIPWLAGHLAEAGGLRAVFVLAGANFGAVAVIGWRARRTMAAGRT